MAVWLSAVFALILLLVSAQQCQEKQNDFTESEPGTNVQGNVKSVEGEGQITAALQNKDWPGAADKLRQTGDHVERGCKIISVTEEPPTMPQPTITPAVPQNQPILPSVQVIALVPNGRYPILLPSGGTVVPVQSVGGWLVPVKGFYSPLKVLLYPSGLPQYPLGQVPLTYRRNQWNSIKILLPANVNPLNPLWIIAQRKQDVPHTPAAFGKRKSSEEMNK